MTALLSFFCSALHFGKGMRAHFDPEATPRLGSFTERVASDRLGKRTIFAEQVNTQRLFHIILALLGEYEEVEADQVIRLTVVAQARTTMFILLSAHTSHGD